MIRRATLALCAASLALAQPRSPAAEIRGVVVDSITGVGIPAATVQLRDADGLVVAEVHSGAEGDFIFTNLPRGSFVASASKGGYVSVVPPTVMSVEEPLTKLLLSKTSVIAGRVLDADGRPPLGATVVPVVRRMIRGQIQLTAIGRGVAIDDQGNYRLFGLAPGWYGIAALVPDRSSAVAVAPVYYPGVLDVQRAEFVRVDAGETRDRTGIGVPPIARHNVSGTVTGIPDGWQGTAVSIIPALGLALPLQTVNAGKEGAFRFGPVPAGHYLIYAAGPVRGRGPDGPVLGAGAREAPASVEIAFRDVEGVSVNLEEGFIVQANLAADPAGSPLPDCARSALLILERSGPNPYKRRWLSTPAENGQYRVESVPRGEYWAVLHGLRQPCYLQRAVSGEQSFQGQAISVDGNANWKLVLGDRRGVVEGAALNAQGEPAPGAQVFLVPTDGPAGATESARTALADDRGRYRVEGVVPGRYRLFAVPASRTIDYLDPAWWSELGAIETRVEPGATVQAEVVLAKSGDRK